ncbi:tripartite tricarboxylate transporter TctB family protein [Hoeflea sp.]|uniref:tripartite tricarboxylate transporter TctB family protein n=1 Tax=Hoeflea sp. TaxID=1940281 RepID=UPI003B02D946
MTFPKDLLPGTIILALCAILFYVTTTFDSDPLGAAQGMPATHMPRLVLGAIAFLTLVMMVQGFRSGQTREGDAPPWKMWATAAMLALTAVLFPVIGVPLAFFLVCIALPVLWGARDIRHVAAFAVAVPVAIYVVFQILLGLRLPLGPLASLL